MPHVIESPFGYHILRVVERKSEDQSAQKERALARQYEQDMAEVLPKITPATVEIARELAALPQQIRGYGFIKDAAAEKAQARRDELLAAFRAGGWPSQPEVRIAAE